MKKIFTFLTFILLSYSIANSQYWEEVRNIPNDYINNYWLDVFFLPDDPSYGWICGFDGKVIRTSDGGNTWLGSRVSGAYHLESIHFPSKNVGYTSGPDGIYKSTNGGQSWVEVTPDRFSDYWGCYFVSENTGLVIGGGCYGNQKFFRTSNGGQTWSVFNAYVSNTGLTDAILYSENGLAYAVSSGNLWVSEDGGRSWSVLTSTGSNAWQEEITNIGETFLLPYAGSSCSGQGNDGGMRFTTNMGKTWNNFRSYSPMFGTYLLNTLEGWACGNSASVYYTSDAGNSWDLKNCGIHPNADLDDIWFVNPNLGFVVGDGVYKYSAAIYDISKDSLFFENFCLSESQSDSLKIICLSFDKTNIDLEIIGDPLGHFFIESPNPNYYVGNCDSNIVVAGFDPKDNNAHTAKLKVTFNKGTSQEVVKFVELIGTLDKASAFPKQNSIIIDSIYCNIPVSKTIQWEAEKTGERISNARNLLIASGISLSTPTPLPLIVPHTNTIFHIQLLDTGWHEAKYQFTLSPCERDTLITVKAYGYSSIISHAPKTNIISQCLSEKLDTIRIFNTGNDILKIPNISLSQGNQVFSIVGWLNESEPIAIAPKMYADLVISYHPPSGGNHIGTIVLENNDSTKVRGNKNPYSIDIQATSEFIELSDTIRFNFGDLCLGEEKILSSKLFNYGNIEADISILDVLDDLSISLSDINSRIKSLDSLNIRAIFNANKLGEYNEHITLLSAPCDKITTLIFKANVINTELEVNPTKISGVVKLGESLEKTIRINSLSNHDVKIKNIYLSPENPDWEYTITPPLPMVLLEDQGADFKFTFTPTSDAKLESQVIIEVDEPCPATYFANIDLSSFNRFVDIDVDMIDFGTFYCDFNEQFADIKVINLGFSADSVSEVYFEDATPVFELVGVPQLPVNITANTSLKFKVKFKNVNNQGVFKTKIIVKTIGNDGQKFIIPVTAEFLKSDITPLYENAIFGDFESCSNKSTYKLEVTNNGLLEDTLILISNSNPNDFTVRSTLISLEPNETKIIEIDFDPMNTSTLGLLSSKIIFESTVCKDTLIIDASATMVQSQVRIEPNYIDYKEKWSEDDIDKLVRITNYSNVDINIYGVQLSDEDNFEIIDSPINKVVAANSSLDFTVRYIARLPEKHDAKINILYHSDCYDSLLVNLEGSVRLEKYNNIVYIDRYEKQAGDTIDIYVKIKSGLDRINPSNIDFDISFDKHLFYPLDVSALNNSNFEHINYSYINGTITGKISSEIAQNLLYKPGAIIKINGIVLLSLPDSTILKINQFDVATVKDLAINKEDGLLKLIDFCEGTTQLGQFQLMPWFDIDINNIAQNGFLNFNIKSTKAVDIGLSITDMNGISADLMKIQANGEINSNMINLQNYSSGIYFLRFKSQYQDKILQIINLK